MKSCGGGDEGDDDDDNSNVDNADAQVVGDHDDERLYL